MPTLVPAEARCVLIFLIGTVLAAARAPPGRSRSSLFLSSLTRDLRPLTSLLSELPIRGKGVVVKR